MISKHCVCVCWWIRLCMWLWFCMCVSLCLWCEALQRLQLNHKLSQTPISAAGGPVVYGFGRDYDVKKLCQMDYSYFLPCTECRIYVSDDTVEDPFFNIRLLTSFLATFHCRHLKHKLLAWEKREQMFWSPNADCCFYVSFLQGQKGEPGDITDVSSHHTPESTTQIWSLI